MGMTMKFETLLDAVCHLVRSGYVYNTDYNQFRRNSRYATIIVQKNGKCRVISS
jgi:HKD family nuclease